MRTNSIQLNGYVLFKDSGIKTMTVDFSERIQIIIGSNGSGKAQPLDALIKTPGGWTPMGNLSVGSKVVTPDGGVANVIGVYPQGKLDIYEITFQDGRKTRCCEDHLWKVYNAWWNPVSNRWRVLPLKDIVKLNESYLKKAGLFVELPSPEVMDDIELPLDPYVLGVLLGDACIEDKSIGLTTPDQFIVEEVGRLLPEGYSVSNRSHKLAFGIRKDNGHPTPEKGRSEIIETMRELGLSGTHSHTKFVPHAYMTASPNQKLALVQGLMDTDGYCSEKGHLEFCSTSKAIAEQMQELIRSLGGMCKIKTKRPFYTHNGEHREGKLAYYLNIRFKDPSQMFRLPRKKERTPKNYQYADRLRLRIKSIARVSHEEAQCIMIDHPDHLYITDDYVVTHNTQFLRQLSTTPPSRPLFDRPDSKGGSKTLVITHGNHHYRLVSDFTKPSSPHGFYIDDQSDNLNTGGTTEVQRELIEEHLGITPFIDDLIMNVYDFPRMGAAKRREFLMDHHPGKIRFMLDLAKQMSSKVKACKNNLARLQTRKMELEQQFLSPEDLEALEAERRALNEDLNQFQQYLHVLGGGMMMVGNTHHDLTLQDLPRIRKTLRRYHQELYRLSDIPRDDEDRRRYRDTTLQNRSRVEQQITDTEEDITKTQELLENLEVQYREIAPDSDLMAIDATITRLEADRDKLQVSKPPFEVSEAELVQRYQEWTVLQDRLMIFDSRSVPLYGSRKRQLREQRLSRADYQQSTWGMKYNDLQIQYDKLSKQHTVQPSDIPDSPCAKDSCPLYRHFMGEYQESESRRQSLRVKLDKAERYMRRLNILTDGLRSYFELSKPYNDTISWLIQTAQRNPVLHHVLRGMDILSVLSHQPSSVARLLQENYRHIEQWIRYQALQSELTTAYALKSRHISSESHDTIKLVSSIEDAKHAVAKLRQRQIALSAQWKRINQEAQRIDRFDRIKQDVFAIQKVHYAMAQAMAERHEKDRLSYLQKTVTDLRSNHFMRLSEIERTLRAQASLNERYQEEVLSQIATIEKEFEEQGRIEAALIALPKQHMVDFINQIFDQANHLISSVWTIPLQIDPIDIKDPLNYNFYVSGDNQSTREMSECSQGQLEIITLSINLAIRMLLKHLDLPLCLDEVGRAMDERHKQNLVLLLKRLIDDHIISELFFVSHHAAMHDGFSQSETLVTREDNLVLPPTWNRHVTIT